MFVFNIKYRRQQDSNATYPYGFHRLVRGNVKKSVVDHEFIKTRIEWK